MKKFALYIMLLLLLGTSQLLQTAQAVSEDSTTCDKVIINLLQPSIREAFIHYYGDELGNQIGLYNYEMEVLHTTAMPSEPVTVALKVIPQYGAHNPIGEYELQFSVDNGGHIQLVSLKSLKIYPETIDRFNLIIPWEE